MAVSLTLALDAPRQAVRVQVDGIPATAVLVTLIRRSPSGNEAGVRGAVGVAAVSPQMVFRDYEAPFDLELTYSVTVYDGLAVIGTATATITLAYDDCPAWLVDLARPTNSLPVVIESLRELAFETPTGVHRVLDRRAPVLTTLPAWTPSLELIFLTDTLGERDQARALLGAGFPFLLRTTPEQGIGNLYLGLTTFVEERFLAPGRAPERRFRVACVQVERPDPAIFIPAAPMTYAAVKAQFATYADVLAEVGTYDALAYLFPENPEASVVPPWLPDDI